MGCQMPSLALLSLGGGGDGRGFTISVLDFRCPYAHHMHVYMYVFVCAQRWWVGLGSEENQSIHMVLGSPSPLPSVSFVFVLSHPESQYQLEAMCKG